MQTKGIFFAFGVISSGLFAFSGQPLHPPAIFTSAQAEAGRVAYENSCGKCHTPTLLGRKGDASELPPLSSLSKAYREFIGTRGTVPPLVGPVFISRWGGKTASQLISRFQETVESFELEVDEETTVNITAYVLQVNGAKAGDRALTRATNVVVNSAIQ